jgi:hypothetical protein
MTRRATSTAASVLLNGRRSSLSEPSNAVPAARRIVQRR